MSLTNLNTYNETGHFIFIQNFKTTLTAVNIEYCTIKSIIKRNVNKSAQVKNTH